MATERVPMRKIREILRLKWVAQRSHREAARSLGVSAGTVAAAVGRARAAALTWEAVEALSDDALERRLFGPPPAEIDGEPAGAGPGLDPPGAPAARRHAGAAARRVPRPRTRPATATRRSARGIAPGARGSGSRCGRCTRPARRPSSTTRAMRPTIVDAATGEVIAVELFVAVLGASNYTFAEATRTQQSADWIREPRPRRRVLWRRAGGVGAGPTAHRRDGAVPLRAGRAAHLRRVGAALSHGRHSGASGETAGQSESRSGRPGRRALDPGAAAPRDLLQPRRAECPHSRAADGAQRPPDEGLRRALAARSSSTHFDRPALQPLPAERFVHADWLQARVNIDYHVEVDHHYYSVPHPLVHELLDVRLSATTVEIFQRGHARLGPCAQLRAGPPHHGRRAHAEGASRASGVESLAARPLGRHHRPRDRSRSSSRFSRVGRIPSRGIAPVSACCASPNSTAPRG